MKTRKLARLFESSRAGRPLGRSRRSREIERLLSLNYDAPAGTENAGDRYLRLAESYRSLFGGGAVCVARAPGRVNLIGEHTDYNGLPVLPFAIQRDFAAMFAPRRDDRVVVSNLDPAFSEREFRLEHSIPPSPVGDWVNYVKAAAQGIMDHMSSGGSGPQHVKGFQAVIDGTIPPAAGLSSSSALVVLGAMMLLRANGLPIPPLELAGLLARAEHYVGTQGGGMDQAASLLCRSGHALKIDFFPLRATPVELPEEGVFVVANSLVRAAKTMGAMEMYNRRPIECRLALAVLRQSFEGAPVEDFPIGLIGDLNTSTLGMPRSRIDEIAAAALHETPYTLSEIASIVGKSPEETARKYCAGKDGSIFPQPPDGFKLFPRYRHVVEEGARVEQSLDALRAGDLGKLGDLMNQSHQSCRDLYEISCPELDALVSRALEAGALGSRLTGAGFGGCTISLVRKADVERFRERLIGSYYREFLARNEPDYSSIVFPCKAVNGAEVLF
jgi:N-acetylgalactosamine kinase